MLLRQMTYVSGQEKIFEEKCREVRPAAESRFPINGQRLLPDRPLARVAQLGYGLVPEPLQLQERDLALGGRQTPSIELPIHRRTQPFEHVLRLLIPAPGVFAPSMGFRPRGGQLAIEITGSTPFINSLPPLEGDAGEGRDENQKLERLERDGYAPVELDREVGGHERRDQREEDE